MTSEQPQSLQTTLDELAGFLVNIKIDMREDADLMPIFEILFPATWQVLKHRDFLCETFPLGIKATSYKFSIINDKLSADDLVAHIKKLINYNEEIEGKQKQLLELQRRREIELEAEIEKLRLNFLEANSEDSSTINETVVESTPTVELTYNFQKPSATIQEKKETTLKSKLVVESYVPEREESEDDTEMIESAD